MPNFDRYDVIGTVRDMDGAIGERARNTRDCYFYMWEEPQKEVFHVSIGESIYDYVFVDVTYKQIREYLEVNYYWF